ncbi:UNVERIFIED_CONTAM: hypothetical protein FKN15_028154 [Acipenser sinensis]
MSLHSFTNQENLNAAAFYRREAVLPQVAPKPQQRNVLGVLSENDQHKRSFGQVRFRPKISYMKKQPDITNSMRLILVDWLVEVGEEYKLRSETLYLAVNYLDRFLSCMAVLRGKLQLVGTAAVLLAS